MPATVQVLLLPFLLLFPFLSHTHTHALTPKMARDLLLTNVQQEMENESTATGISTAVSTCIYVHIDIDTHIDTHLCKSV
jgi:hypothetical protein